MYLRTVGTMDKNDIEMLEKLNQLKENKILTEEEFNAEKNKILNQKEDKTEKWKMYSAEDVNSNNTMQQNMKETIRPTYLKALEITNYITAALILLCMFIYVVLMPLYNTRLDYGILNYLFVITNIIGWVWIAWFISSVIYLILTIKDRVKPKMMVNILVGILVALQVIGQVQKITTLGIGIITAAVGLVFLDVAAIIFAGDKGKLVYKCAECGEKISKDQTECPNCKTKINWD